MKLPDSIQKIMRRFHAAGFSCYVVGGGVRDTLLGRKAHDYDLCTDALPRQTMALFEKTILTGVLHGTVTVVVDHEHVEVTTFRTESGYVDHRHPTSVCFVKDVREDLARRDFTINAIAYAPETGIIDPFDGRGDLARRRIRAVGDPDRRFQEDALRMVRAHRFAASLGFAIEPSTLAAIERNAALIRFVAVERLLPEWMRILWDDPFQVRKMLSLWRPWLPELEAAAHCEQNTPYHSMDVLDHTLCAIGHLRSFDPMCAFALLLHDLGKPFVRTTDPDGRDHFKGHPKVSVEIAKRVCRDLKLPNAWKKMVPELVRYHDEIVKPSLKWLYRFRVEQGWDEETMRRLFAVQYADIMAHSNVGRQRLAALGEMIRFYEEESKRRPLCLADLALSGQDVMALAPVQGKAVGQALKSMLDFAFYHPEQNTREGLTRFIKERIH